MTEYTISAARRRHLNDKQNRVIENYSSRTKFEAVVAWKRIMQDNRIKAIDVSKASGIPASRISEWTNFYFEPKDDAFKKVDKALKELVKPTRKKSA